MKELINFPKIIKSPEDWETILKVEKEEVKQQAMLEGVFLKAPNGLDSNLKEGQWLTVRTESFKSWFGDWETDSQNASKVVDENGEPRVVYHATSEDFSVPRPASRNEYGPGFYTGGDIKKFTSFTSGSDGSFPDDKTLMPLFLNIRNPENAKLKAWKTEWDYFLKFWNKLKGSPYDGGFVEDWDFFITLRPEQVKSAIGNNGRFDKDNPNILE